MKAQEFEINSFFPNKISLERFRKLLDGSYKLQEQSNIFLKQNKSKNIVLECYSNDLSHIIYFIYSKIDSTGYVCNKEILTLINQLNNQEDILPSLIDFEDKYNDRDYMIKYSNSLLKRLNMNSNKLKDMDLFLLEKKISKYYSDLIRSKKRTDDFLYELYIFTLNLFTLRRGGVVSVNFNQLFQHTFYIDLNNKHYDFSLFIKRLIEDKYYSLNYLINQ